jgi:superfamily I DNA/RNA helicase
MCYPNSPNADPDAADDSKFLFNKPDGGIDYSRIVVSQYLKICHDILSKYKTANVFFLSRTRFLPNGVSLKEFQSKLRSCLPTEERRQFDNKVRVMTAHASKGLEADIVVVLRVVRGAFPLIHPDSSLYRVFGKTDADELLEERHLFYVACTRARSKLMLITENGEESDFLH